MESLFSFQRIWVKLPRQASGECRCASAADGVPEADFPGCASNCCLFAAAEFGALETVTDLKALLAELLPSCFFTDYRLALYRGEGVPKQLLGDSERFASLGLRPWSVIEVLPSALTSLSATRNLERLLKVLFDPAVLLMRRLPSAEEAETPREGDGSGDSSTDTSRRSASEESHEKDSILSARRRRLKGRRRRRSEKQEGPFALPGGTAADAVRCLSTPDSRDGTDAALETLESLASPCLGETLLTSLLKRPTNAKPKASGEASSCRCGFARLLCISSFFFRWSGAQCVAWIRVSGWGPPPPSAVAAGHLRWVEVQTLEGTRLFVAAKRSGFVVCALRRACGEDSRGGKRGQGSCGSSWRLAAAERLPAAAPLLAEFLCRRHACADPNACSSLFAKTAEELFPLWKIRTPEGTLALPSERWRCTYSTAASLLEAFSPAFKEKVRFQWGFLSSAVGLPRQSLLLHPFEDLSADSRARSGAAGLKSALLSDALQQRRSPRLRRRASSTPSKGLSSSARLLAATARLGSSGLQAQGFDAWREVDFTGQREATPLDLSASGGTVEAEAPALGDAFVEQLMAERLNVKARTAAACSEGEKDRRRETRAPQKKSASASGVCVQRGGELEALALQAALIFRNEETLRFTGDERRPAALLRRVVLGGREILIRKEALPSAEEGALQEEAALPPVPEEGSASRLPGSRSFVLSGEDDATRRPDLEEESAELAEAFEKAASIKGLPSVRVEVAGVRFLCLDANAVRCVARGGASLFSSSDSSVPASAPSRSAAAQLAFEPKAVQLAAEAVAVASVVFGPSSAESLQRLASEEAARLAAEAAAEDLEEETATEDARTGALVRSELVLRFAKFLQSRGEAGVRALESWGEGLSKCLVEETTPSRNKNDEAESASSASAFSPFVPFPKPPSGGDFLQAASELFLAASAQSGGAALTPGELDALKAAVKSHCLKKAAERGRPQDSAVGDGEALAATPDFLADSSAALEVCESLFGELESQAKAATCLAEAAGASPPVCRGERGCSFFSLSIEQPAPLPLALSRRLAAFVARLVLPATARVLAASASVPLDGVGLKEFLHLQGLRCRHLGAVLRALREIKKNRSNRGAARRLPAASGFSLSLSERVLERAVFVRSAKWLLRRRTAQLSLQAAPYALARLVSFLFGLEGCDRRRDSFADEGGDPASDDFEAAAALADAQSAAAEEPALRCLLGESALSVWKALRLRAWRHFVHVLPSSAAECAFLQTREGRLAALTELCEALGLQLKATALRRVMLAAACEHRLPSWMAALGVTEEKASLTPAASSAEQRPSEPVANSSLSAKDVLCTGAKAKRGAWTERPVLAAALSAVAARLCFAGDFDAALETAQDALCAAHQLNGAVSKHVAVCYGSIGRMLLLLGDGAGAASNFTKALILRERSQGVMSVHTAGCHQALAEALMQEGSSAALQKALHHQVRALALLHVWSDGGVVPEIPLTLLSLASTLMARPASQTSGSRAVRQSAEKSRVLLDEERRRAEAAVRCIHAAAAAARELSASEGPSLSEVFSEVSWALESVGSLREAAEFLQIAREALRRETAAEPGRLKESDERLARLTRRLIVTAHQQQQALQVRETGEGGGSPQARVDFERTILLWKLREAIRIKRSQNAATVFALS